ncbi:MAG: ribosome maturation factor RimM, partial [Wenzhouxiangella sp.]|nr:ribosome maturation factor RimM [Wenzhouxiangella sp.]
MTSTDSGDAVTIGRILGAWGVQGWVQVYSWADPPEALFDYTPWFLGGSETPVKVENWRRSGQKLVAQLS